MHLTEAAEYTVARSAILLTSNHTLSTLLVGFFTSASGVEPQVIVDQLHAVDRGGEFLSGPQTGTHGFWRSVEGVEVRGNASWSMSQASPIRRCTFRRDLALRAGGQYVSGGFISNSVVDGVLRFDGQQQYLARNCRLGGGFSESSINIVLVGCEGVGSPTATTTPSPSTSLPPSVTAVPRSHRIAEKPYLAWEGRSAGNIWEGWSIVVPSFGIDVKGVQNTSSGARWIPFWRGGERVVYVMEPSHSEEEMHAVMDNEACEAVVLAPGVCTPLRRCREDTTHHYIITPHTTKPYTTTLQITTTHITTPRTTTPRTTTPCTTIPHTTTPHTTKPHRLSRPLMIHRPGFVLLGIGLATLVCAGKGGCIEVEDGLEDVRIGGVLLEAGVTDLSRPTQPMLRWGRSTTPSPGGLLSDVHARLTAMPSIPALSPSESSADLNHLHPLPLPPLEGCSPKRADVMLQLSSSGLTLDHSWLWHADHDQCAGANASECSLPYRGTCVSDACVSSHGLLVDGNGVSAYGLQVEHHKKTLVLPYTEPSFSSRHVGYEVVQHALPHSAAGLGVYVIYKGCRRQVGLRVPHGAAIENMLVMHIDGLEDAFRAVVCSGDEPLECACSETAGECPRMPSLSPLRLSRLPWGEDVPLGLWQLERAGDEASSGEALESAKACFFPVQSVAADDSLPTHPSCAFSIQLLARNSTKLAILAISTSSRCISAVATIWTAFDQI
ncbi:MAG: hypothetical protein SGPRY_001669 [Prymnesium sp.]